MEVEFRLLDTRGPHPAALTFSTYILTVLLLIAGRLPHPQRAIRQTNRQISTVVLEPVRFTPSLPASRPHPSANPRREPIKVSRRYVPTAPIHEVADFPQPAPAPPLIRPLDERIVPPVPAASHSLVPTLTP